MVLLRGRKLGLPEMLGALEDLPEVSNVVLLGPIDHLTVVLLQLGEQVIAAELAHEFEDVALDLLRVPDGVVPLVHRLEQLAVERLHPLRVHGAVLPLKVLLTLGL